MKKLDCTSTSHAFAHENISEQAVKAKNLPEQMKPLYSDLEKLKRKLFELKVSESELDHMHKAALFQGEHGVQVSPMTLTMFLVYPLFLIFKAQYLTGREEGSDKRGNREFVTSKSSINSHLCRFWPALPVWPSESRN